MLSLSENIITNVIKNTNASVRPTEIINVKVKRVVSSLIVSVSMSASVCTSLYVRSIRRN